MWSVVVSWKLKSCSEKLGSYDCWYFLCWCKEKKTFGRFQLEAPRVYNCKQILGLWQNMSNKSFSSKSETWEDANSSAPVVLEARPTKCPCSSYDFWNKYEFCFVGCKCMKDCTAAKRRRDYFEHYKRNHFGVLVGVMVRTEHTEERARI